MPLKREDNFEERRGQLKKLSDEELKERFWELTGEIVDPLVELARTHTSPSIERSVLLRMGFNSLDARAIVTRVLEADLLGKGAGHVVLKFSQQENKGIKEAGLKISRGEVTKDELKELFTGGDS